MGVLAKLEPQLVFKHFEALCAIPHPSGHEGQVAEYVIAQAKHLGLASRRDEVGNVLVTKPATAGHEKAPTLVLQGHLDMVGVAAPGVKHDFLKDPIKPRIDGDYVRAEGTTLGADNGIGGSMMLALMEERFEHGELEFLFTINEEAGMDGAHGLKGEFLKGRRLLNLDTEEWGEFYISCAGGGDSVVKFPAERAKADAGAVTALLTVSGLKGGHSGMDINLGRGSGNRILARLLTVGREAAPLRLHHVAGGNKRNAIADGAEACLTVPAASFGAFQKAVERLGDVLRAEYSATDPGLAVTMKQGGCPCQSQPLSLESSDRLLRLLMGLPHGVLAMSTEVPGLVETSVNLGTVETKGDEVKIVLLTRSAVTSRIVENKEHIKAVAALAGAKVEEPRGYPGWKPNPDSTLLKVAKALFARLYGREPKVKAVHAGLECGLFSEKLAGADMLSLGPSMANVHSPAEELYVPTVPVAYDFLKKLVTELG